MHRTSSNSESFEKYEYSKSKSEVDKFFWHIFCDQYLEIVKDRLFNGTDLEKRSGQETLRRSLLASLKLFAPILPHITEEIYQLYYASGEDVKSIHVSSWPSFDEKLVDVDSERAGDYGVDIINAVRKFKSEQQMSLRAELSSLVLISEDDGFDKLILEIVDDLKSVLKVGEILFEGATSMVTEKFSIKVGINK